MAPDELRRAGQTLAALIGDPPPRVNSKRDLKAYAEYVEMIIGLQRIPQYEVFADVRRLLDPEGERKRLERGWARYEHRRDLHKAGGRSRRLQGAQTERSVGALLEKLENTKGSASHIISKRLGITIRHVNRIKKKLGSPPKKRK